MSDGAFLRCRMWWAESFAGTPRSWTRSPLPPVPATDKRGLRSCQDNATVAIVKSHGYCAVSFSCCFAEAHIQRHTPAQAHKKATENCDRIGRLYSSEDAALEENKGRDFWGGEGERFKNTSEQPDQSQRQKSKARAQRGEKQNHK